MKKRLVSIGSCLTNSTLLEAEAEFDLLGAYDHLRSDFVALVLEGEPVGVPDEYVEPLFSFLENKPETKIPSRMLKVRLRSNAQRKLSKLREHIVSADIVVLDTNYDFGREINFINFDGETYCISNLGVQASEICSTSGRFNKSESRGSFEKLLGLVFDLNPKAQIVFFNYPVTAFRKRLDPQAQLRIELVKGISDWVSNMDRSGQLPQNLTVIDCTEVPEDLLSEKGVLYFQPKVYQAFAKVIDKHIEERWDGPSYIPSFSELQRFLPEFSEHVDQAISRTDTRNPYSELPERQYWKPAVADPYPLSISNLYDKRFEISKYDVIATCGSCFAQHIGRRLAGRSYNFLDMEPAPAGMSKSKATSLGYGIYSARYGNVYTSRQLLQLFNRAFGEIEYDEVWVNPDGKYVDPFRPNLCGIGFETIEAVRKDQIIHLNNVREMFKTLDIFVFTLGLTETWKNRQSGAVYPMCPGVTAGEFDSSVHDFVNLDYLSILEDMELFLSHLRHVNPSARVLLTVSPVPLTATAVPRHVLVSTMASKSILRAVADQIYRKFDYVDYFPSYDIIMSPPYKAMFFKSNLRNIHEEGVDHVMSHFFAQHDQDGSGNLPTNEFQDEVFCDESFLDLERKVGNSG